MEKRGKNPNCAQGRDFSGAFWEPEGGKALMENLS